jgi:hypothetical protein
LLLHGHSKAIHRLAIDLSAAHTKAVSDNFDGFRIVYDKFRFIENEVKACNLV